MSCLNKIAQFQILGETERNRISIGSNPPFETEPKLSGSNLDAEIEEFQD